MVELDGLRGTGLLAGLDEQDLIRLGTIALERSYLDGELLFSLGEEARELMVVTAGEVQLEFPVEILGEVQAIAFETKRQGEVVGWSVLVPPHRFTLSGRARGGAKATAFPREELITLFEEDPALGYRIMTNLAVIMGLRLHRTRAMWSREIQRSLDERYR